MPSDPWVLGFDTAAPHCAAALLCGDRLVAHQCDDMTRGQVEHLMPLLESLLTRAGITWRDLSVLGVGTGPGNFTGTRISIAAARGLALGLGIPAIGVSTLEAQAHGAERPILSLAPAPRDQLYAQMLDAGDAPRLCTLDDLPSGPAGTRVTGHRADEAARRMGWQMQPATRVAEGIARIAATRKTAERPAPLYLTPAGAAPPSDPPPTIIP